MADLYFSFNNVAPMGTRVFHFHFIFIRFFSIFYYDTEMREMKQRHFNKAESKVIFMEIIAYYRMKHQRTIAINLTSLTNFQ